MKKTKRIISIFLFAVMLLSTLSISSYAAGQKVPYPDKTYKNSMFVEGTWACYLITSKVVVKNGYAQIKKVGISVKSPTDRMINYVLKETDGKWLNPDYSTYGKCSFNISSDKSFISINRLGVEAWNAGYMKYWKEENKDYTIYIDASNLIKHNEESVDISTIISESSQ